MLRVVDFSQTVGSFFALLASGEAPWPSLTIAQQQQPAHVAWNSVWKNRGSRKPVASRRLDKPEARVLFANYIYNERERSVRSSEKGDTSDDRRALAPSGDPRYYHW